METQLQFPVFRKLLMQNDFKFITHFLKLFEHNEDRDKRALQGIVAILTYEEEFDPCFSHLLQIELSTRGINTGILRGSTACTRLITEYLRMHQSFLSTYFSKILLKVIKRDHCSEINPHLMDDPNSVRKRTKKLLDSATKVFKALIKSPIPSSISDLCIILSKNLQTVQVELPETTIPTGENKYGYFAVSNTLFLHFLCPFLANPPKELTDYKNARRTLVMFAKLFQALANGASFDVDWMKGCNNWLTNTRKVFEDFCETILNPNERCDLFSLPNRISSGSSVNLMNRWKAVYKWVKGNRERILEEIEEAEREKYEEQLNYTFTEILGKREGYSPSIRKASEPKLRSITPKIRRRTRSSSNKRKTSSTRLGSEDLGLHRKGSNGLYAL